MTVWRNLFPRLARTMSHTSPHYLSEAELRAMSHQQLLAYTLEHLRSSIATPMKRPVPDSAPEASSNQPEQALSTHQSKKKKRKMFDMSRYGQRMVALRLVYTGWRFHGFASQETSDNTVEHHLFTALLKTRLIVSRDTCSYSRSGRTDVGVSALGQVIGIRLRSNIVPPSSAKAELDYVKVINGNLPDGIRVLAWTPVSDGTSRWPKTYPGDPEAIRMHWKAYADEEKKVDNSIVRRPGESFSARFDANYRSYKYFFVRGCLNIDAMRMAGKFFEGNHDFRNFCRIDENVTNFERRMYAVEIRRASDDSTESLYQPNAGDEMTMYYVFVKGQAFLWHQVRCMSAVLFDVGMGREQPSIIKRMLEDPRKGSGKFSEGKPQYRMASPIPLVLYECAYPDSLVAFPQQFDDKRKVGGEGDIGDGYMRQSTFERADEALSKCYAEVATQASVLEAMLRENDSFISMGGSATSNGDLKIFGECRQARNFLLNLNKGKHIPYDIRSCDDSLEIKQKRAALKKKGMEM